MDRKQLVVPRSFRHRSQPAGRYAAIVLAILIGATAQQLSAQAIYSLDEDGALTQLEQKDAAVSQGYASQPVFYTLGTDGLLTGTDRPQSMPQQPGGRVLLVTSAGRRLEVAGRIVNVRKSPGLGAAITTKLQRGTQVISVEHDGEWVKVAAPDSETTLGWMYEPLLTEVFGYSAIYGNSPRARFRRTLEKLKEDDKTRARYRGLESPELNEGATMSLIASEAWLAARAQDRWEIATHLGRAWRSLTPVADTAILNIKDEQGRRQMTIIRP